jgi:hypothetical protein
MTLNGVDLDKVANLTALEENIRSSLLTQLPFTNWDAAVFSFGKGSIVVTISYGLLNEDVQFNAESLLANYSVLEFNVSQGGTSDVLVSDVEASIPFTSSALCDRGYYCPGGVQGRKKCPHGKYNNNTGSVDISDCSVVAPGYYSRDRLQNIIGDNSVDTSLPAVEVIECEENSACPGGSEPPIRCDKPGDVIYRNETTQICGTSSPSLSPSSSPTKSPSKSPSQSPSKHPTKNPTSSPSNYPSSAPTNSPSKEPSRNPSVTPSSNPSASPTGSPTSAPTSLEVAKSESQDDGSGTFIIVGVALAVFLIVLMTVLLRRSKAEPESQAGQIYFHQEQRMRKRPDENLKELAFSARLSAKEEGMVEEHKSLGMPSEDKIYEALGNAYDLSVLEDHPTEEWDDDDEFLMDIPEGKLEASLQNSLERAMQGPPELGGQRSMGRSSMSSGSSFDAYD